MILEILGLGKSGIIWDLDNFVKKQNQTKPNQNNKNFSSQPMSALLHYLKI